jgi:hypothetical protein
MVRFVSEDEANNCFEAVKTAIARGPATGQESETKSEKEPEEKQTENTEKDEPEKEKEEAA